jgi:hypothetical protein
VPYERAGQSRVLRFAQSIEEAASLLTAFLIGPIMQLIFIPFMTTGAGVEMIGGWFGTGPDPRDRTCLRTDRAYRPRCHRALQPPLSAAQHALPRRAGAGARQRIIFLACGRDDLRR